MVWATVNQEPWMKTKYIWEMDLVIWMTRIWPNILIQKRQQAPNGVTCTKPMSPNWDFVPKLITISTSPRSGLLNQSVWNYLVSTSKVICLLDPCYPLKEGNLATNNPLFASNFLFPPRSVNKRLPFCTDLWSSSLSARLDIAWFKMMFAQINSKILTYLSLSFNNIFLINHNITDAIRSFILFLIAK